MILSGPLGLNLPLTEPRIMMAAIWTKDTALLYGASISTAFLCAGEMARGLEAELRKQEAAGQEDARCE